jgi:hypothetical protein
MPQPILPMFSSDMTAINDRIAVKQEGDTVFWFQGMLPVFRHHVSNESLFRSFCCQLINIGNATSSELAKALNVNHEKLSRWARLERAKFDFDIASDSTNKTKTTDTKKKSPCLNP